MRQRAIVLGIGLVLGAAAALLVPRWLAPALPESWRPEQTLIVGQVLQKVERETQVRLVVETEWGALLASFTDEAAERVRLLVDEGDEVALVLSAYQPFVDNPEVARVVKGGAPTPPSDSSGQPG
ncbi:MAG: hypothetical protein HYT86_01870 [candidate division NC10 bacterium]|nr:hypothetical protein [candidate division NC10 bacterium]